MDKNMKKYKYNSVEEISEAFIKDGWSVNTSFTEVTMEEAEKKGYLYAVSEIRKGKKVFRMNVCGNIYSENGKLLYYNIEPCRIVTTF